MPTKKSMGIDTVPLPERPFVMEIKIPKTLIDEFKGDVRVVIRHPWIVGIPVLDRLVDSKLREAIGKDFEILITPRI